MGFFSRLFGKTDDETPATQGSKPKVSPQVARLQKKVENKYGQAQERQIAIRALVDLGTEEAISAVLMRFTFRIDQTIGDEEEKREVFDSLVRLGPVAIKPILEFLERENAPFWAVKALREIVGDEKTVSYLIELTDRMEAIFDRDIQRKVELVSNLREFKDDPRVREKLLAYLKDENEELRVHAIEGLAEMGREEMGDLLVERLLDDGETQRLKTAILNLLIEKKWKLKGHKENLRKVIPATFWIDDVGVIHRR